MALKVYTRTGDQGTTALFGAGKVSKTNVRVQAYGEVDELNAVVGVVRSSNPPEPLPDQLRVISEWLFTLGADLATPRSASLTVARISPQYTQQLEQWIDQFEEQLPPLKHFILPGGLPSAAYLHLARTVCRRAERAIVALAEREDIGPDILPFINRLSDFFFVAARWANYRGGVPDELWQPST